MGLDAEDVLNWSTEAAILSKNPIPRVLCAGCEKAMRQRQRIASAAKKDEAGGVPLPGGAASARSAAAVARLASESSPPPLPPPAPAPAKKAAKGGASAAAAATAAAPVSKKAVRKGAAGAAAVSPLVAAAAALPGKPAAGAPSPIEAAASAASKAVKRPLAVAPPSSGDGGGGGVRQVHVLPGGLRYEMEAPAGGRPKRAVRQCADCGGKSTSAWWGRDDEVDGAWLSYTINSAPADEPLWCDSCVTAQRKVPRGGGAAPLASPRSAASDRTEVRG